MAGGRHDQQPGRFRSRRAVGCLPSEDLAVARFKTGDAMFALTNYAGALENYRAVLDDFTDFPQSRPAWATARFTRFCGPNLALKDAAGRL